MLRSLVDKKNRASNCSPSMGNLVIVVISKSVRLIAAKGKLKPFIEVSKTLGNRTSRQYSLGCLVQRA